MKRKYLKMMLAVLSLPFFLTSCEVFGLDFQDSYDFDYEIGMPSNKINMSAYDFIQSRTDIFTLLAEAIDYAEIPDEYRLSNMTYLLPTDEAFKNEDDGYFAHHQLSYIDELTGDTVSYAPITMTAYPKEQVKEFLLYHIVKGAYTFTNLPAEPTWFETEAVADTALVNIYLLKDRNPNITFNNFEGHYLNEIKPRTSNLFNSDDSYMHVLDNWLDRPTREQLTGFE